MNEELKTKGTFGKALTVVVMLGLAAIIPAAVYVITTDTFDLRDRAAEVPDFTVCPEGASDGSCTHFGGDGIQQAIDASTDGNLIHVKPGTYTKDIIRYIKESLKPRH